MIIRSERRDDQLVLHAAGPLDRATAETLHARIVGAAGEGVARIVLDMDGITRAHTSGLAAIVRAQRTLRTASCEFRIARANERVRLLLEMTALERILFPYPSIEAALDSP